MGTKDKAVVYNGDFKILSGEEPTKEDFFDSRHLVYCREPSYSIDSYVGYIELVMELLKSMDSRNIRNKYMLELGFLPVIMPPSFWRDKAHDMILPKLREKGFTYFARPGISFINYTYSAKGYPDIWVSKMDAADTIKRNNPLNKCDPLKITVRRVLEECNLINPNGV